MIERTKFWSRCSCVRGRSPFHRTFVGTTAEIQQNRMYNIAKNHIILFHSYIRRKGRVSFACASSMEGLLVLRLGRSRHVTLLAVESCNVRIYLLQDEFNRVVKVGNVTHLELGTVPQKGDQIAVPKETFGRTNFHNIWVHYFRHLLTTNTRLHANASAADCIFYPGLTSPSGGGRDDADNRQNAQSGKDSLGDRRRTLIERFLGS